MRLEFLKKYNVLFSQNQPLDALQPLYLLITDKFDVNSCYWWGQLLTLSKWKMRPQFPSASLNMSLYVSALFHSFHYFRKWDCCFFLLKRSLPPSLRSPYLPDFSVPLSSRLSFLTKSFLHHQLLDAVTFDSN